MTPIPPLLAFGFGNLAMLGWLAAAAAPLLIHLWSRHRFREVDWAAIQFLLAAMRKNARRLQLQQWLLLAVRTLMILLVVLAVAEPYGSSLSAGSSASAPAHKILVIDSSYSMAYIPQADDLSSRAAEQSATHFARAKQLAAELIRDSSSADAFTVIVLADPARTVLGREVVDPAAVADQVLSLSQSQTGADLAATLDLVAEALQRNADDPRGLERQEVYFFTDLQRTTWAPGSRADADNQDSALKDRIAALASQAALVVVDVGTPHAANLVVTQIDADEPFITIGREVAISATLHQFGDQPRSQCVVELSVDDQPVGEQTIDVPAGGEANVHFTHRFNSPGSHALVLRAADDELPIDNSRFLAVPVKERLQVLCVAGREGAAKYVASALNPDPTANSAIEPVIVTEGDLEELELADFDCIFLCNVAQLTAGEAERLTRYAAAGGGIVIFLGDHVISDQYNALHQHSPAILAGSGHSPQDGAAISSDIPLLPAHLGPVTATTTFGIDPLDYRHPIVAPFRGRERAGLLTTPINRYFKLETPPNRADAEIAAALPGGDPLIVAAPLGRGRTIVVATDGSLTSVDPATGEPWTTWPTWPSFLPIVRELLAYTSGGRNEQMQQPIGATLGGRESFSTGGIVSRSESPVEKESRPPGAATSTAANLQIVRPDGRTEPLSVRSTPEGWQWSYDKTDTSGIYTLRGVRTDAPQQFAINVDTSEGDLTKANAAALPPELLVRDTWQTAARGLAQSAAGLSPRSAWNLPLLWTALALLFVESFLAWQFGRGTA